MPTTLKHVLPLAILLAVTAAAGGAEVLMEAEAFDDRGGWVVDQQFMDQMGLAAWRPTHSPVW